MYCVRENQLLLNLKLLFPIYRIKVVTTKKVKHSVNLSIPFDFKFLTFKIKTLNKKSQEYHYPYIVNL